ncbi:MAG: hypothetical protein DMD72_00490 [Gemmatimonadetes bacterium]|nr:MAG: hypothetical protein DMD72_00490 [Gemmatimonadota bacterium]
MYLEFYGLTEKPFNPTPDPRFLYMSPAHREALAQLLYGVQERRGFIALTGKVGTGKTTLLHALRQQLNGQTAISFVFNSTLPFDGILEYVLEDLGIATRRESRAQRLIALNNFLIDRARTGQNTVLMLDEAQNLAPSTLAPTDKLLQILLVGQPELKAKLCLPELRQLKQRIGLRCQIPPLTLREAGQYIRTRLRIAGAHDLSVFTDPALDRITEYSGGIPRLINIVCDHCLLFGYADQERRIGRPTVDHAIEYLEEGARPARKVRGLRNSKSPLLSRWGLGTLAVVVAGAVLGLAVRFDATVLDLAQSVRHLLIP